MDIVTVDRRTFLFFERQMESLALAEAIWDAFGCPDEPNLGGFQMSSGFRQNRNIFRQLTSIFIYWNLNRSRQDSVWMQDGGTHVRSRCNSPTVVGGLMTESCWKTFFVVQVGVAIKAERNSTFINNSAFVIPRGNGIYLAAKRITTLTAGVFLGSKMLSSRDSCYKMPSSD